jgi:hypothetical protein
MYPSANGAHQALWIRRLFQPNDHLLVHSNGPRYVKSQTVIADENDTAITEGQRL